MTPSTTDLEPGLVEEEEEREEHGEGAVVPAAHRGRSQEDGRSDAMAAYRLPQRLHVVQHEERHPPDIERLADAAGDVRQHVGREAVDGPGHERRRSALAEVAGQGERAPCGQDHVEEDQEVVGLGGRQERLQRKSQDGPQGVDEEEQAPVGIVQEGREEREGAIVDHAVPHPPEAPQVLPHVALHVAHHGVAEVQRKRPGDHQGQHTVGQHDPQGPRPAWQRLLRLRLADGHDGLLRDHRAQVRPAPHEGPGELATCDELPHTLIILIMLQAWANHTRGRGCRRRNSTRESQ